MSTACKILPAQPAPCISFYCLLLSSTVFLWCSWREPHLTSRRCGGSDGILAMRHSTDAPPMCCTHGPCANQSNNRLQTVPAWDRTSMRPRRRAPPLPRRPPSRAPTWSPAICAGCAASFRRPSLSTRDRARTKCTAGHTKSTAASIRARRGCTVPSGVAWSHSGPRRCFGCGGSPARAWKR